MSFDKIIYRLTDKRIPAATGIGLVGEILERAGFQEQFRTYNILRMLGQETVHQGKAHSKRIVARKRIRTVIQNIIHFAGQLTKHARRLFLSISRSNDGYEWVVDLDIEKYFDTVNHDKLIFTLRHKNPPKTKPSRMSENMYFETLDKFQKVLPQTPPFKHFYCFSSTLAFIIYP